MTRDFVGYGPEPPRAQWPGDARIAVNFVINFEEGSELSYLHVKVGSRGRDRSLNQNLSSLGWRLCPPLRASLSEVMRSGAPSDTESMVSVISNLPNL